MKSSKGKGLIGLLILLIAVGLFGFLGYDTMDDIKLGLDLAGGVSITYQAVEEDPGQEEMSVPFISFSKEYRITVLRQRFTRKEITGSILIFREYPMPMRFWRSWVSPVL